MTRSHFTAALSLAFAAFLVLGAVGCADIQLAGSTRSLGTVSYQEALDVSTTVLARYFPIDKEDRDKGIVESGPVSAKDKAVAAAGEFEVATLHVRREGRLVYADLQIAVLRQTTDRERLVTNMAGDSPTKTSGAPNLTPAERDGANTPRQNEQLRTVRYDHTLERQILQEINDAMPKP